MGDQELSGDAAREAAVKRLSRRRALAALAAFPGLALAQQLYLALAAQGHERDGTHALELALATMSGFGWENR